MKYKCLINKKYLFGTVISGVTLCAALAFNVFAFPNVLAAVPEEKGVKAFTESSVITQTAATKENVSADTPGVNAITEEQAVRIAQEAYGSLLSSYLDVSGLPYVGKYVKSSTLINEDCWFIMFFENDIVHTVQINAMTGEAIGIKTAKCITKLNGDEKVFEYQMLEP